jgi:uncharacterized protein
MTTDKTGAPTSVDAADDKFTIAVDGQQVGLTAFVDHDNQRIFHHTEVDDSHEGRGLATILVSEAVQATRAAGKRIVAICALVASYLDKHHDLDDIVDPVTDETEQFVRNAVHTG